MLSSRFALVSGACVGGWILARPLANGLRLSPDMVYGPLVAAVLVFGLVALLFRNPVLPRPSAWALMYLVYLAVLALRQITSTDGPGVGITLHGFAALGLPVMIYLIAMRSTTEARARVIHLFIGPLLGFSAIVSVLYFYLDFTLWGLIQHHVYTDLIHTNDAVDRRAIGLLASPQSHALSMVVLLVIAVTGWQQWPRLSLALGSLAVVGGLLSGSKAFLLGALLVSVSQLPRALVLLVFLPLLLTAWFASGFLADTGLRALTLLSAAQNVDEYTATPLWMAALSYASDIQRLTLGLGLGVMGALSEALESSPLDFSSTESYLLQIAVEVGLLGLLLFIAMLASALRRAGQPDRPAISPLLFMAIFVNAIFTPAFYGFGNAALAGLLLAHTRRNP